jgi:hypothetical protein
MMIQAVGVFSNDKKDWMEGTSRVERKAGGVERAW